jgi:hypothetical protein
MTCKNFMSAADGSEKIPDELQSDKASDLAAFVLFGKALAELPIGI